MAKSVGIQKIAEVAGVHRSTVSRALRDDTSVAEDTRRRVQRIAEEMDYRPNLMARGLAGQSTQTVAIISWTLLDQFYVDLLCAQEQHLRRHGYSTLLAFTSFVEDSGEPRSTQTNTLDDLVRRGVDGFLFHEFPRTEERKAELLSLIDRGIPLVMHGDQIEKEGVDLRGFDVVTASLGECGYDLACHLVRMGHRRIAYIGETDCARYAGYLRALAEFGIEPDPRLAVDTRFRFQNVAEMRAQAMSAPDRPTALFAYTDDLAIELITELREDGFRVPEDVSVVGVNDTWHSRHMQLTTVRLPVGEMAQAMVEMLLERIAQPELAMRQREFDGRLVIRQTVSAPLGNASAERVG